MSLRSLYGGGFLVRLMPGAGKASRRADLSPDSRSRSLWAIASFPIASSTLVERPVVVSLPSVSRGRASQSLPSRAAPPALRPLLPGKSFRPFLPPTSCNPQWDQCALSCPLLAHLAPASSLFSSFATTHPARPLRWALQVLSRPPAAAPCLLVLYVCRSYPCPCCLSVRLACF